VSPLAVAACLSDLLLAMFVFTVLARPEKTLGLFARFTGYTEDWQQGTLSEDELYWLVDIARRAGPFLLIVLFLYSFAVGVLVVWSRL